MLIKIKQKAGEIHINIRRKGTHGNFPNLSLKYSSTE